MLRPTTVEYHHAMDDVDIGTGRVAAAAPTIDLQRVLADAGITIASRRPLNTQPEKLHPGHYPCLGGPSCVAKRGDSGRNSFLKGSLKGQPTVRCHDAPTFSTTTASRGGSICSINASVVQSQNPPPPPEVAEAAPATSPSSVARNRRTSIRTLTNSPRVSLAVSVAFSTIEFRSYEVILGDSPACAKGAPITLGWRYDPSMTRTAPVEATTMGTTPSAQQRCAELILSEDEREVMLLKAGYSKRDLAEAVRKLRRSNKRWRRERTCHNLYLDRVEEFAEGCGRKLRRGAAALGGSAAVDKERRRTEQDEQQAEEWRRQQHRKMIARRSPTPTTPSSNAVSGLIPCLSSCGRVALSEEELKRVGISARCA